MEKLYLERYDPLQVEYRPILRRLFQALNQLPYFGKPVVNFQFVVSSNLERNLRTPSPGWIIPEDGWVEDFWRDGDRCGVEAKATGKEYHSEYYVGSGPMAERQSAKEVAPLFVLNVSPEDYEMRFYFLDRYKAECSLWTGSARDKSLKGMKIGDFSLPGEGGTQVVSMSLPETIFNLSEDADNAPGSQIAFRFRDRDGDWLTTPLMIDQLELWAGNTKVADIELENRNLAEWYVREVSNLFKEVDRTLCGGALINEKLTHVGADQLYGLADQAIQIAVVPNGYSGPPPVGKASVEYLQVKSGETLARYRDQVVRKLKPGVSYQVENKSPLVYVNKNVREDGRQFLTLINHSPEPGRVEVDLDWKQLHKMTSSELIGKSASYVRHDNKLSVDLDGYGALVLSNRKDDRR